MGIKTLFNGARFVGQAERDRRKSTLRSTLDIYTQAITPAKHAAQAAVLSLVFSGEQMDRQCQQDQAVVQGK